MTARALFVALTLLVLGAGCTKSPPPFWIYTSVYPHVVEQMKKKVAERFPGVDIRWYQSGSENVAAKVTSELLSGHTRADILMTSDLFWYEDLREEKQLLSYDSPLAAKVPAQFKDPGHAWAASRVPMMIISYNSDAFTAADAPKSWADLAAPRFKDKIAMPSPLESGTTFTTVAMLERKLGWDYFQKLRANGAISAGGNSAVIARIESKERPVGIVLLENVLATRHRNPKVTAVYPAEGAITVPSPMAITAGTKQPELARRIYDYFFSHDAQLDVVKGEMYSIFFDVAPPPGAIPFSEALKRSMPWDMSVIAEIRRNREDIKQKFSDIMLE